ncbi:phage minor tail protein L [Stenotrophomonas maltophilia]|uniref:phage minor tail protein L n=1 Tax=Stenotrophomonas maltophilia TaxID=40324 RepID=UPI001E42AE0F|nr:phage minor tail protein L [Stenotrophomonas maltophilia]
MITADAQQLEPGGRVTVYELDASSFGADQLFFHAHLQSGVIWWQGQEYGAWPIEATGFERTSDQPPNPRLKVGNLDGRIAAMCMLYGDMVGAKVIRRQTLVKYLDGKNFPALRNKLLNSSMDLAPSGATTPTNWLASSSGGAGFTRLLVPSNLANSTRAWRWTLENVAANRYCEGYSSAIAIESGVPLTVSAYVRGSVGPRVFFQLQLLDAAGATVGWTGTPAGGDLVVGSSDFTRKSFTFTNIPANVVSCRVFVRVYGNNTPTQWFDVDNVQAESGAQVTEYQYTGTNLDDGRNPTADPNEHFLDEIWFIERKVSETKEVVEFELTTAIDLNGEQLPGRQIISGVCGWLIRGGYRGPFCGYTGPAVAAANDMPTTDPARDQCGGRVGSCKLRFGADKPLPYGGFPASGLLRT